MTFTYVGFTSGEADDSLWSKITNQMNGLTTTQAKSVKVASSDMRGKDARAVIIYTASDAPNPKTLGSTWFYKNFETGSDYNDMYAACVQFLNETTELSDTQKYYARLSMTNAADNKSHLVLYYRSQE